MTPEQALALLMQELQQAIDLACKLTGLGYLDAKMKRLNEAREILATAIQRPEAHSEEASAAQEAES